MLQEIQKAFASTIWLTVFLSVHSSFSNKYLTPQNVIFTVIVKFHNTYSNPKYNFQVSYAKLILKNQRHYVWNRMNIKSQCGYALMEL